MQRIANPFRAVRLRSAPPVPRPLDALAALPALVASLALAGLTFWDVLGREPYRAFMMSRAVTVGALFEVALVVHLRSRRAA